MSPESGERYASLLASLRLSLWNALAVEPARNVGDGHVINLRLLGHDRPGHVLSVHVGKPPLVLQGFCMF